MTFGFFDPRCPLMPQRRNLRNGFLVSMDIGDMQAYIKPFVLNMELKPSGLSNYAHSGSVLSHYIHKQWQVSSILSTHSRPTGCTTTSYHFQHLCWSKTSICLHCYWDGIKHLVRSSRSHPKSTGYLCSMF